MDETILTPAEKMERVVERLTRERDEERGHKEAYFKAGREAEIEVEALRQRVEELEQERGAVLPKMAAKNDEIDRLTLRVEELERERDTKAKLARCVEIVADINCDCVTDDDDCERCAALQRIAAVRGE